MIDRDTVTRALATTLDGTDFHGLGERYVGKVRDNYTPGDGRRILVTTDRISAFDRVLGTLPLKGQVLNLMAAKWFEQTKHVAPNHVIDVPDPQVLVAKACTPLPVEMVMRSYVTGVTSTSIWTHYQRGVRVFCGHTLPDGLVKNAKLPAPILTPSTKAEHGDHDVSASREEILAMGHVTPRDFDAAAEMASALFAFGQARAAERGLILVDTKYEFGKDAKGELVVIDEIHTPDSSRYWFAESYAERFAANKDPESFDKEYVAALASPTSASSGDGPIPAIPDEVRVEAATRYIAAYERLMGESFTPNVEEAARAHREEPRGGAS